MKQQSNKELSPLQKRLIMQAIKIGVVVADFIVFGLCWVLLSDSGKFAFTYHKQLPWYLLIAYVIVFVLVARLLDSFDIGKKRIIENIFGISIASITTAILFYIAISIAFKTWYTIDFLIIEVLIQVIINTIYAFYGNKIYFKFYKPRKSLIIYSTKDGLNNIKNQLYFDKKYIIKKKLQNPTSLKTIKEEISKVDIVLVTEIKTDLRDEIIKYCVFMDKKVYITPSIGDILLASGKPAAGNNASLYSISRKKAFPEYAFIKRLMDILLSFFMLIVLSPLMALVALAIKIYDDGPVIYKQKRYTINGEVFEIMKFRSMKVDAEKDGVARLSMKNDDRITPVGKIIRAIRFDELPQLFNIFNGQMSFVGPRPERPEICEQYAKQYPYFNLRLQVKAGLTGYAQVYGKYNTEPEDKLKMDLYYIENQSLILDLKLMFMTIRTIFSKESTEAVNKGNTTALKKKKNGTKKSN